MIHDGVLLKSNLRKEKLTEDELIANLRKRGFSDIASVKLTILEADGEISALQKD